MVVLVKSNSICLHSGCSKRHLHSLKRDAHNLHVHWKYLVLCMMYGFNLGMIKDRKRRQSYCMWMRYHLSCSFLFSVLPVIQILIYRQETSLVKGLWPCIGRLYCKQNKSLDPWSKMFSSLRTTTRLMCYQVNGDFWSWSSLGEGIMAQAHCDMMALKTASWALVRRLHLAALQQRIRVWVPELGYLMRRNKSEGVNLLPPLSSCTPS